MRTDNTHAPVEVVMAINQPDGHSQWTIPVRGSLVDTKRILNSDATLVHLDLLDGEPIAVNPSYVVAIQIRREVAF